MRLNVNRYLEIIRSKGIEEEAVRRAVGLSEKTYNWIMENHSIENSTLELIADSIGCKTGAIYLLDSIGSKENVIEWIRDENRAGVTLTQGRYITRVEKLAEEYPDECQVVARNEDGSIFAHVPVSWVKIGPPRNVSEEQRQQASERMIAMHRDGVFSNSIVDENT